MGPVRTSLGVWNRGHGSTLPPEDYDALVYLFTLLDEVYVPVFGSPHEDCDEAPYLELLAEPTGPGSLAGLRHAPPGLEPFALVVVDVTDAQPPPEELPPELAAYNFRWRHVEGLLQGPAGAVRVFGTVRMFTRDGVDYALLTLFDPEDFERAQPPLAPLPPVILPPVPPPSPYPEWCPGIVVDRNSWARDDCKSLAEWQYRTALVRARDTYDSCMSDAAGAWVAGFALCILGSPNPLAFWGCTAVVSGYCVWLSYRCHKTYDDAKVYAEQDLFVQSMYCDLLHPPDWDCVIPQQEDPGVGNPSDGIVTH